MPSCEQPGCERSVLAKELCSLHYQRMRAGLPLDGAARSCRVCGKPCRVESGYDFCSRTKECRKARSKAYYDANKDTILANSKLRYAAKPDQALKTAAAYREANRELIRLKKRDRAYGLASGEYQLILTAQGGRCKGCQREGKLYVDHDHGCCATTPTCGKCNRGLLCEQCNWVLGFARDSPATLRALAAHLEDARGPEAEDQG